MVETFEAAPDDPREPWVRYFQGKTWYSAAGPKRTVLILVSREEESEDVVHRKEGKLLQQDKERIISEIHSECWREDVDLIEKRYRKDNTVKSIKVVDKCHMKREDALTHIKQQFNNAEYNGATIHYIGPGKKDAGDWCFSDGFITFKDIENLYLSHFKGKTLVITADCSYSGQWVERCKDFLDVLNVRPCGHFARTTGIQLKVFCSCQPNEIGYTLLYSARGNRNDKNTGAKYMITDMELAPGQTTCFIDSTKIYCDKIPQDQCILMPDFTFAEKTKRSRILRKFREIDQNQYVWHVILLEDDPEKIHRFEEVMQDDLPDPSVTISDYGRLSRITNSEEEVDDWILRMKNGIEDINYDTDFM